MKWWYGYWWADGLMGGWQLELLEGNWTPNGCGWWLASNEEFHKKLLNSIWWNSLCNHDNNINKCNKKNLLLKCQFVCLDCDCNSEIGVFWIYWVFAQAKSNEKISHWMNGKVGILYVLFLFRYQSQTNGIGFSGI